MTKQVLSTKKRKLFGRRVKQLRAQGIIPGNVFGPKTKSVAVSIDKKTFHEVFEKAGETSLIDLTIDDEKEVRPVLISNLHLDPITNEVLHVDLHQVDLKQKTTAEIPLEFVGESSAVKGGGVLVTLMNEVEVEALPTDLPDKIEVDISILANIGDSILAKDLKLDRSKVELKVEEEEPVVTVQEPEEEEEAPAPAAEEDAAEGGESPAESKDEPKSDDGEKSDGGNDSKS